MSALRYFEDLQAGEQVDLGEIAVTEAEMLAFARDYDPQPFHLDPVAAEASPLRGLAASGWMTCALGMRLFWDGFLKDVASLGAPGVADCRWLRPVFASERAGPLRGHLEILSARASKSRPEVGLVEVALHIAQGEAPRPVCRERFSFMARRREPGPPPPAATPKPPPCAAAEPLPASRPASETMRFRRVSEIPIGEAVDLGETVVSAEAIIGFAGAYDPQPFHLDEEAGRASLFGGLSASGWHTTALFMRRLVEGRMAGLAALSPEDRAVAAAAIGPALGFTDLSWRRPVLAGDRLRCFSTAIEIRPMESRPDWALVIGRQEAFNQRGALALRFQSEVMTRR